MFHPVNRQQRHQVSISPTFYKKLFNTKVISANLCCTYSSGFYILGTEMNKKLLTKMLVKLTSAPGKKRTKRFLGKKETTTTAKPPIAGAPLPQSLTATVPPPFLFDTIEAVVEGVDACKPYIFSIKIYSPRNAVMGEIEGNLHDLC
jgi:hypothetical protein